MQPVVRGTRLHGQDMDRGNDAGVLVGELDPSCTNHTRSGCVKGNNLEGQGALQRALPMELLKAERWMGNVSEGMMSTAGTLCHPLDRGRQRRPCSRSVNRKAKLQS